MTVLAAPHTLVRTCAAVAFSVAACAAGLCHPAVAEDAPLKPLHRFLTVAMSPDGTRIASTEGDAPASGGDIQVRSLVIRDSTSGEAHFVALPCGAVPDCTPSPPTWAPDGTHLAFVLRSPGVTGRAIYVVRSDGSDLRKLADFDGTLNALRYGPGGQLAALATLGAKRDERATRPGAALAGEVGQEIHEQRIALFTPDEVHWASPPDLFVYEYDWLPDGSGVVGTAAPGEGDAQWWSAKLYAFELGRCDRP